MTHTITLTLLPMALLAACALEAPGTEPAAEPGDDIPCTFLKGLPSELSEPPLPAAIVTPEDFTALALSSPLAELSPASYKRFVDSLTFSDKGVSSFRYVEIEAELEPEELEELYLMLGMRKKDTVGDYYCASRATCRQEQGALCITTNC